MLFGIQKLHQVIVAIVYRQVECGIPFPHVCKPVSVMAGLQWE
eukprot:XP_001706991.1 Hypothetical protein GL50803_34340 [Giardia lamblia ATCC 50803]